ncbi:MAG: lamin tail domain-containing protein [Flavobacteriales bacterium]|nr:lamin tail domain-containing protein [Flavobacteriales bacterium]
MKKLAALLIFVFFIFLSFSIKAQTVIISEYADACSGTQPKALEIWNPTGIDINLSSTPIVIETQTNANSTWTTVTTINSGILSAGEVIVISDAAVGINGSSCATKVNVALTHNGDDAFRVKLNGVVTDVFGDPSTTDPGTGWSGGGVTTWDGVIEIQGGITTGNTGGWTDPSTRFQTVGDCTFLSGFGFPPGGCPTGCSPDVTLGIMTVSPGNMTEGTSNNVIYSFSISAGSSCAATLTGLDFTTTGTAVTSNFSNMKVWYSTDNTFNSGSDTQLGNSITSGMGAGTHTLGGSVSQTIAISTTGYIFITADLPCGATAGNTVSVSAITSGDLTFSTAPNSVSGSTSAGGTQTIVSAGTPNNVTGASTSTCENGESTVSWTLPTGCYDNILVVAHPSTAASTAPSGNGGSYSANATYGSGTAYDAGYVVYKGTGTTVTVSGLTNGTTYYYTIFTRNGTTWSSGVTVNCTPSMVYCTAASTNSSFEYIQNVEFGSLFYSSGASTYSDYTSEVANVIGGGTADLTVSIGDYYPADICIAWIDWNGDGDFLDAGEEVMNDNTLPFTATVSIPSGTITTRMRIRLYDSNFSPNTTPCGTHTYGEIEDYTVTVCTPTHTVTSFAPTTGPIGTQITITGTGFTASSSVEINGVAATTTYVDPTTLTAVVANGTETGSLIVYENGCQQESSDFTIIDETGFCAGAGSLTDLFISEVYDSDGGNTAYIELYNPTGASIDLAALNYAIRIENRNSGGTIGATRTVNLTGTIPAGGVFLLNVGTSTSCSGLSFDFTQTGSGYNDYDRIYLVQNGTDVDRMDCPSNIGYSWLRLGTAAAPTTTYNAADWDTYNLEDCSDLGNFTLAGSNPSISSITDNGTCSSIDYSVIGTAGNAGTLTYQWYYNDGSAAGWTAVTSSDPSNLTISGETSDNLVISSGSSDISTIDGYQFYCEVIEDGACTDASNSSPFISTGERYYRSAGTGNWSTIANWQMGPSTSGPWAAACTYPTATNSDYISVESGTTITLDIDLTADQIIVQTGGILQLEQQLTVENGNGSGEDLEVIGTLEDHASNFNNITFINGSTWLLDANGTVRKTYLSSADNYRDAYEGGISNIPATAEWYYEYDASGDVTISTVGMFYPNLYFESSSGFHNFDGVNEVMKGSADYCTVKGNLYIGTTNSGTVQVNNNNGNAQPLLLLGDMYIGSGSSFYNASLNSNGVGTGIEIQGTAITVDGTFDFDASGSGITVLSGSAAQLISSTSGGTFHTGDFEIDNASGADLDGIDVNISNTLTFTDGVLRTDVTTTDMFNITNSSTAAVISGSAQSATNRYIDGRLQWSTTSGNTYRFPVGSDVATYGAQGFDITIDAGSGAILGYLETNTTSPIYANAYCDFEDHPGSATGITVGSGNAGYDGILDRATFNLNSDLQWDITNTSGSVTQYDLTVLATGNQDINPTPHPDNLAVSANGVEIRYLMKNGEPGNPGVATTSTVDFPTTGFDMCPTQYTLSNLTSFSHFTLDGPTIGSTELPVELTVFEAKKNGSQVDLTWVTESEINVSHFVVERSKNGMEFQPILSAPAQGNSTSTIQYDRIDYNPLMGKSFYRLQSVDFDGSFEYSDVRTVEFDDANLNVWNDKDNWNVIYKSKSEDYLVRVYNNIGQVVRNAHIVQNPESKSIISHQDLPAGIYIMVIEDNGVHQTVKVIK